MDDKKSTNNFLTRFERIFFSQRFTIKPSVFCVVIDPLLLKNIFFIDIITYKHLNEYSKYVGQEKYNLIKIREGLKLVHQEGCSSISHIDNTISSKALIASYAISNLIAKHSKSFMEGQFEKECLIAAVQSFGE